VQSPRTAIGTIKSRMMRWAQNVARRGEKKWLQGVCGGTKKTTRGRSSRKLKEISNR